MSRMTDERLRKVDSPNMALSWDLYVEVVEALKAERAKVAEQQQEYKVLRGILKSCERDYKNQIEATQAQLTALPKWAQSSESKGQFYRKSIQEMATLRAKVAELKERLTSSRNINNTLVRNFQKTEAQLTALRQGLDKLITDLKEAGATLPAPTSEGTIESAMRTGLSIALLLVQDFVKRVLTQPTPTVNSAEAVNGGEDSDTARVAGKL